MKIIETAFEGLFEIIPTIYGDDRGYFMESYNATKLSKLGIINDFVQDNEAYSSYGVLRGLHYQLPPYAQAKLVRVIEGEVLDVAVDLRKGSKTYGEVFTKRLNSEIKNQLLIPAGFAHGYVVLSPTAHFLYKCDKVYSSKDEGGILFNDPSLEIDWIVDDDDLVISDKDLCQPFLGDHRMDGILIA